MPNPSLDRRSFLLATGAAPAAYALGKADDPSDMAAFGRLNGLKFTAKELDQADDQLDRLRADYRALRAELIDFEMALSSGKAVAC